MNQILSGLPFVINGAVELYEFLIFVYCIMSFIPNLYNSFIGRFVVTLVAPFLNLIRKVLPIVSTGFLDFSPIVALIIIQLLQKVIYLII